MTIKDIRDALGARFICGEELQHREVHAACGSDMMSDVLAFMKNGLYYLQDYVILRLFVRLR